MKKLSWLIVVLGVFVTLSASAAWSQDPAAPKPASTSQQPAAMEQSVRGKVTNVSATSITIEAEAPKGAKDKSKAMEFVTDPDTKTEGTVEAGVTVTITYKVVDGRNIATRINVEKK